MNFQELTAQYFLQHFKQVQMNRVELSASAFWSDNYQFVRTLKLNLLVMGRRRRRRFWHQGLTRKALMCMQYKAANKQFLRAATFF